MATQAAYEQEYEREATPSPTPRWDAVFALTLCVTCALTRP